MLSAMINRKAVVQQQDTDSDSSCSSDNIEEKIPKFENDDYSDASFQTLKMQETINVGNDNLSKRIPLSSRFETNHNKLTIQQTSLEPQNEDENES